ncbi:MAG: hypothetical protein AAF587_42740 [Bacteroidota bacterium]
MRLFYFFLLLGLATSVVGQYSPETSAFLTELRKARYLFTKEYETITSDHPDDEEVLWRLYRHYHWRDSIHQYVKVKPSLKVHGAHKRTLTVIDCARKAHFVPDSIIEDMTNRTLDLRVRDSGNAPLYEDVEVFKYLYEYQRYRQRMLAEVPMAYLDSLRQLGLLPASSDLTFAHDKHWSRIQVLNQIDRAILVRADTLKENLANAYRYGMEQVAKLDPRLSFTDFSFEIVQRESEGGTIDLAQISFTCANTRYRYLNSLANTYDSTLAPMLGSSFYQIFNRILVENDIPYRLVFLTDGGADMPKLSYFSGVYPLLLVTKDEWEFLKAPSSFPYLLEFWDHQWYKIKVSAYEKVFDILSKKEIQDRSEMLEAAGFYRTFTPDELASSRRYWQQNFVYSTQSLWEFESLIVTGHEDGFELSIQEKLMEFSDKSYDLFQIMDTSSLEWVDQDTIELRIQWRNESSDHQISRSDLEDANFLADWINSLMASRELDARFYKIDPYYPLGGSSYPCYVLLSPTQYQLLKDHGWANFMD